MKCQTSSCNGNFQVTDRHSCDGSNVAGYCRTSFTATRGKAPFKKKKKNVRSSLFFSLIRRHLKVTPGGRELDRAPRGDGPERALRRTQEAPRSCATRGLPGKTGAHLSMRGEREVGRERLRVREVGPRAPAPQRAPSSGGGQAGAPGGFAGAGGLRPPGRRQPPAPGSPQGLALALGEAAQPTDRRRSRPGRATSEDRSAAGGGHLARPGREADSPGARGGRGRAKGRGAPQGVALRALPAANDSPSRGSAAAGYSRRAGRTWRAAASRGC